MDLSKLKVETYDFLAILIPGLLVVCEAWITIRGWSEFILGVRALTAPSLTILLLLAYALGHIAQELGDAGVKWAMGERHFRAARDRLWKSETGHLVRQRIQAELGTPVESVDVAFDYCLTCVQTQFAKRDLFLANSDLARSLVVCTALAVAPLLRITLALPLGDLASITSAIVAILLLALVAGLCWARMNRFRALSETPVFHAYLTTSKLGISRGTPTNNTEPEEE